MSESSVKKPLFLRVSSNIEKGKGRKMVRIDCDGEENKIIVKILTLVTEMGIRPRSTMAHAVSTPQINDISGYPSRNEPSIIGHESMLGEG